MVQNFHINFSQQGPSTWGQVGASPMWAISTSALWDSFWTQISTVLTPRGQVQAVYWGKGDMIKSVGFSKVIQMTEGIKKDSSSQAGGSGSEAQAAAKVTLWPQGAGGCSAHNCLSLILMISAKTHAGFWYLLQERHKAEELQRGMKKTSGDQESRSCPQCFPKLPSQTGRIFCYKNSVWLSLYYSLWLIRAHRAGWTHFSIWKSYWTSPISWKPNHCVQSREQGEEAGWDSTVPRTSLSALGYLRPSPSPTLPIQPELGTSSS